MDHIATWFVYYLYGVFSKWVRPYIVRFVFINAPLHYSKPYILKLCIVSCNCIFSTCFIYVHVSFIVYELDIYVIVLLMYLFLLIY